ncbi:glycosyltransferase family 4 protein [Arenimonas fontis]|uniref:Lipopolysaccharide biosynthesis protein n=1 Tax=Arenimonas fontis TaxID=2608255 RepID=A0A5B2ZEH4_9GAMM|nr:lipopolysaccharide biosynthesis protein [Arenimonas fontis]KAA2285983.1 lipopolysaccharide biosynthesis protein [Arenimonas fontis]
MSTAGFPPLWPAWLGVAMATAALLAWVWRGWALRYGIVDRPDARRLHAEATARGGGIGIVVALLAAATPALGERATAFALGLALVAGTGLLDDLKPLPAAAKALGQALGALPLAWVAPLASPWPDTVVGVLMAWLLVMALVNIWNFMDGSNGLAASQAALFGLALAGMTDGAAAWLGLVLAMACLGFLPANLPRAQVFLGDVGSHSLGFAVAAGVLIAGSGGLPPWLALLPALAFVTDATLTLAGRLRRGEKVWLAHREHLYQRAIAGGVGHGTVCLAYAVVTAALAGAGVALARQQREVSLAGAVVGAVLVLVLYLSLRRRWPMSPHLRELQQ